MTAGIAWYGSAAALINTTWDRTILPVGVWVQPKKKKRNAKPEPEEVNLQLSEMKELKKDDVYWDEPHKKRERTLMLNVTEGKINRSSIKAARK